MANENGRDLFLACPNATPRPKKEDVDSPRRFHRAALPFMISRKYNKIPQSSPDTCRHVLRNSIQLVGMRSRLTSVRELNSIPEEMGDALRESDNESYIRDD